MYDILADCTVSAIGKPVLQREQKRGLYGSWMMESNIYSKEDKLENENFYWETQSADRLSLLEYHNRHSFRQFSKSFNYTLPLPFSVSTADTLENKYNARKSYENHRAMIM